MATKRKRSNVVKDADKWMSAYIRKSACVAGDTAVCFTCGKHGHWKYQMQAGHFQSRSKYSTRWAERNVRCQCSHCNITNGGQQYLFGLNLDVTFGEGTAQQLVQKGMELVKLTTDEIIDIAQAYRQKFEAL